MTIVTTPDTHSWPHETIGLGLKHYAVTLNKLSPAIMFTPTRLLDSNITPVKVSPVKWTKIADVPTSPSNPTVPQPRHGHRAVVHGNYMIVFGGGNEGIVDTLQVFNTTTHTWFQPEVKGQIPSGRAACGMVIHENRMLVFGGMIEFGGYCNDLYQLNLPQWRWKKLKPVGKVPCPRIGPSFTVIQDQVFLFGGLTKTNKPMMVQYHNDLNILQVKLNKEHGVWTSPVTFGQPPVPRESHTAVAYKNKLFIYGGMNGWYRLGDLHILDVNTLTWTKPEVRGRIPNPRSLHTATLIGSKMYVFGGWVPITVAELRAGEREFKCTNSLAYLDLETLSWSSVHEHVPLDNDKLPKARAGHSAVVGTNSKIYVWSGRDTNSVVWNDLWQLEVERPVGDPGKVDLLCGPGTNWLRIGWKPVQGADSYVLQCGTCDDDDKALAEKDKLENWMDVMHTRKTDATLTGYYSTTGKLLQVEPDMPMENIPLFVQKRVNLQPGTKYKFRVTGVNGCGEGNWGEVRI